ncbi:hypothetical protein KKG56_06040, partial [bacterium]|nr:hypothetical protein [bacterium]
FYFVVSGQTLKVCPYEVSRQTLKVCPCIRKDKPCPYCRVNLKMTDAIVRTGGSPSVRLISVRCLIGCVQPQEENPSLPC